MQGSTRSFIRVFTQLVHSSRLLVCRPASPLFDPPIHMVADQPFDPSDCSSAHVQRQHPLLTSGRPVACPPARLTVRPSDVRHSRMPANSLAHASCRLPSYMQIRLSHPTVRMSADQPTGQISQPLSSQSAFHPSCCANLPHAYPPARTQ